MRHHTSFRVVWVLTLLAALCATPANARLHMLVGPNDKIVTFGDSISTGNCYGYYAWQIITKAHPDWNVTWNDQGHPGWTAEDAIKAVPDVLAQKPTVVTVMFGTNDLGNHGAKGIAAFYDNEKRIVDAIKQGGARVILLTTPMTNPDSGRWGQALNKEAIPYMAQIVYKLAADEHVPVFDMFSAQEAIYTTGVTKDKLFTMFLDGVHPNDTGHELMGKALADFLLGKSEPVPTVSTWAYTGKPAVDATMTGAPIDVTAGPVRWPSTAAPLTANSVSQVDEPERWHGATDISATAYLGWDAVSFYLTLDITDDHVVAGDNEPDWGDSGVELFFDTRPRSLRGIAYGPGCYQMLIAAAKADGPAPTACGAFDSIEMSTVKATYRRTPTGYTIDASIPWEQLGFKPKPGADFGFDYALNKRDAAADKHGGQRPRYKMLWRGWGDDYNNLGDLGVVTLRR